MSKKYANVLKKKKRKVIRIDIPTKAGDYMDNLIIDLKNLAVRCDALENQIFVCQREDMYKPIDTIKMTVSQVGDNFGQILKILGQRGVYASVRKMEQL